MKMNEMKNDIRILGEGAVVSTNCKETGLNNNIIVYGTSGCGKTMSVAEPLMLHTFNTNLVVTVTKRRLVKKYSSLFKRRGYRVLDLNFVEPDKSNVSYDPLAYTRSFSDIAYLAKSIVGLSYKGRENSNADPYWETCAVSMLTAEICISLCIEKKASFSDVLTLHDELEFSEADDGVRTNIDSIFDDYKDTELGAHAYTCWKSFRQAPIRTAGCIFSTLNTVLQNVFTDDLRKLMRMQNKLDFETFTAKKTVLFVTTSAVNPAINSYINMFYSQLFKELFEVAERRPDGVLPIPVHVLCDDFATGGRIQSFPEYISIFREKQISVTLLLQSESQLDAMYGSGNATTIINNCDTCLYMGGMDLNTCSSISRRIDLPLDEVLYMPVGKMMIFRRGQRPIITTRYNVENDPMYAKITAEYEEIVKKEMTSGSERKGFGLKKVS